MALPTVVRRWAYIGALVGAGVSIAANILHSYVPPEGMPPDWTPATGAVVGAVFWPVALLIVVELFARWHPVARRFKTLRWVGLVPVAVVAAVVSYRHMSGLLAWWHEDPVTVVIGPLAVDGIMVMAAGALIATSPNADTSKMQPTVEPQVTVVVDPVAPAVDEVAPAVPPVTPPVGPALASDATTPQRKMPPRAAMPPAKRASVDQIRVARATDPGATQPEVARATGLGKRTVARYWQVTMPPADAVELPVPVASPNGGVPHAT